MGKQPQWIREVVDECRALVASVAPQWPWAAKNVQVRLSTRRTRSAGSFRSLRVGEMVDIGHIVVNVKICNTPERFRWTLLHEFAHALVHWDKVQEREHHGPAWRARMRQLGLDPDQHQKHSYDLQEAFGGKYYAAAACAEGHEHRLSPGYQRKLKKGARFLCTACLRAGKRSFVEIKP